MKTIFTFLALFTATFSFGQFLETLDKNNVSLIASAEGQFFNGQAAPGYEIPKGSGIHAIYNQSIWFGALDVNGQLRVAAERYDVGAGDFFPGPYSSNGSYTSSAYTSEYIPAVWKVSSADIDAHNNEYASNGSVLNPHPSILNWPGNGDATLGTAPMLAPFIDINADGIYDPYAGDFPDIKGCEGLYIIMNDNQDTTGGTGTPSMDIEVHVMLYQYSTFDFLNDITFMDIRVINRGTADLFDMVSATYTDIDLGGAFDDYMGSDPVRNLVYQYNGDDNDEGSFGGDGYGQGPPALGVMYLNQTMTHAGYFVNGGAATQSDPSSAAQYWNYMNGKWRFGDDWYYGGTGFAGSTGSTNIPTSHMFTGPNDPMHTSTGGVDPGFEWSEVTNNNPAGDRRVFGTMQQGTLAAGDEFEIHQAIVFGRDSTLTSFDNVLVMQAVADSVQAFYDGGLDVCNDPFASIVEPGSLEFSVFPNPSQGTFTVEVPDLAYELNIQVIDVYGKLVYSSEINSVETKIELNEATGLYFVTIGGNGVYSTTKLMID